MKSTQILTDAIHEPQHMILLRRALVVLMYALLLASVAAISLTPMLPGWLQNTYFALLLGVLAALCWGFALRLVQKHTGAGERMLWSEAYKRAYYIFGILTIVVVWLLYGVTTNSLASIFVLHFLNHLVNLSTCWGIFFVVLSLPTAILAWTGWDLNVQ